MAWIITNCPKCLKVYEARLNQPYCPNCVPVRDDAIAQLTKRVEALEKGFPRLLPVMSYVGDESLSTALGRAQKAEARVKELEAICEELRGDAICPHCEGEGRVPTGGFTNGFTDFKTVYGDCPKCGGTGKANSGFQAVLDTMLELAQVLWVNQVQATWELGEWPEDAKNKCDTAWAKINRLHKEWRGQK